MVDLHLEAWSALAPTLESEADWAKWLTGRQDISNDKLAPNLKHVPMMLRRRFNQLGKGAMGAISALPFEEQNLPCVFASQHGDTVLTLSLLESIAQDEDMSPTGFSLAVHNAVSGLYSIACKNKQAITAISASNGHLVSALIEVAGQLQVHDRVLCVLYDVPLPEVYSPYSRTLPFPYAISMVFNRHKGRQISLQQIESNNMYPASEQVFEIPAFISFLLGSTEGVRCILNGATWAIDEYPNVA
ncbi:3-oxoacyl-ACP synthase [Agaribacter marinus]|uniref:3-oxoacyl-ACP synthase n=1 Tax=Agaribacter marinus TaxID=1431249 RepID=A0AA37SW38_9ALTE|nr:3-oxoacyl-ACP synthase [Agaribacter marinus]